MKREGFIKVTYNADSQVNSKQIQNIQTKLGNDGLKFISNLIYHRNRSAEYIRKKKGIY